MKKFTLTVILSTFISLAYSQSISLKIGIEATYQMTESGNKFSLTLVDTKTINAPVDPDNQLFKDDVDSNVMKIAFVKSKAGDKPKILLIVKTGRPGMIRYSAKIKYAGGSKFVHTKVNTIAGKVETTETWQYDISDIQLSDFEKGGKGYSLPNNTISLVYGAGTDGLFTGAPGAAGFASKGMTMIGVNYTRHIKGRFSIETGLEYSNSNLLWDYEDAYDPTFRPQMTSVKLLSIPVYGNVTFFKYAFLNAGFSVDIEMDHPAQRIAPEQSGIGVFAGLGGKYTFGHITLFANPFVQTHRLIAFGSSGTRSMEDLGFKFGAGYSF